MRKTMDANCTNTNDNVYFRCRKDASFYNEQLCSREKASELLGVSPSTMSNYELGITVPSPEIIMMMADLYHAPELKAHYCKNQCVLGRCMKVATEVKTIEGITLRLLKDLHSDKVAKMKEELIDIAADGKIDGDEPERLKGIIEQLDDLSEVISELKLLAQKCGR